MSGAELITVLGAAASVFQICQSCAKIIKLIRGCQPTEFLQTLEPQVHLLKHDVEQLKRPNFTSPSHSSLDDVLLGCQRQLTQLSTLIQEYHENSNLSRSRRLLQAPKLAKSEKEIQKTWTVLCEYKSTITLHLSIHTATRMLVATDSADDSFVFHVPFERNLGLVGRDDVFYMISDYTHNCTTWPCIIFLTGDPGIGKTQVAIELCYRSRNQFAKIAWMAAHNQDHLKHGFSNFAHALSKEQPGFPRPGDGLEYIKRLAGSRKRPWLMVFDDHEFADIESDLLSFINDGRQRDLIVVTTRASTSREIQIEIPPLTEENATKLLLQDLLPTSMPNELEAAKALVSEMGHLPLPLHLARGFIESNGITVREYLQLLKDKEAIPQSPYKLTKMYRTIFDRIQSEDRALFDFLLQISILRSPVPGSIFHDYYLAMQENCGTLPSYYRLFIDEGQWSPERFLDTIMRISAYGMINKKLEGGNEMLIRMNHSSIHDSLQGEIARDQTHHLQLTFHATAIVAASLSIRDWEMLSLNHRSILYSHAEFCIENRRSTLTTLAQIKEYGGILEGYQTTLAAFLAYHGKREVAKDLLWQSVNFQSTWLAERAGLTCTTLECLILVHLENVDLNDAETLINRLTAIESRIHPKKRHLYLNILLLKGLLQTRKQNLESAISAFKECAELSVNTSGASYITAADSLASGAEVLLMQGDFEAATQNIYDAASLVKLAGGSPTVEFRVEWNLARLSSIMGDYVRAIRRYHHLIEDCQEHYGSHYQRWSLFHCELGHVYRDLGDMQNAEYCYEVGRASTTRRTRPLGIDTNYISPWLVYETLIGKKGTPVAQ